MFLINIATSNKSPGESSLTMTDYQIRYILMNFIIIFGSIVLLIFAVVNIRNESFSDAAVCITMSLIGVICFFIARSKIPQIVSSSIMLVFYGLLCVILVWIGAAQGANFLFIYMYPLLTIMLLGMKGGVIAAAILLCVLSAQMLIPALSNFNYHIDVTVRMITSYILVFVVMIVIETTRKTKDRLIEKQNNVLMELNKKLESLSNTDELTKLNNRRSLKEYMDIVWKQNHRLRLPLTVMMLDIDFFKDYNDSLGHLEGDKALIALAQCLKDQIKRETDFIARFGGEEFIIILPFVSKNEAMKFAETLVKNVEKMSIPHPMSEVSKHLTISVGLDIVIPDNNNSVKQLLDNADKALYKAKQSGRNRVAIY